MTEGSMRSPSTIFSRTMRAMAKLLVGSMVAKILTFFTLPLLTRLYMPEDFGVLGVFTAFTTLLVPLVTMQFNHAIPIPRTDAMAANLVFLALTSSLVVSLALWITLSRYADPLLRIFDAAPIADVWQLLSLAALFIGFASTTSMWQVRKRRYGSLTSGSVFESALGNATKLVCGLLQPVALGLIIGQIANMSARFLIFVPTVSREVFALRLHIVPRRLLVAAQQYASFPVYRMPSQFVSSVGMQLPVLYLAPVHGAGIAGQFSLAMLAITMPLNLIGRNLGNAFYAEASNAGRKDAAAIHKAMVEITKILAAVGIALATALAFGGPFLFSLVFGVEWLMAGQFAAVLSVTLAFRFVSAPLMNVLSTFRREDIYLWIDIQHTLSAASAFGIAFAFGFAPISTVTLYSGVMVVHHLISISVVFRVIGAAIRQGN